MTEQQSNVPDVVRAEPTREVAHADTDSWIGVASDVIKLAQYIAPTEFVPKSLRDNPPAAAAAILYGREVGLPPMTALTQTHVIEGRPSMAAEAMRALVLSAGHEIQVLESTGAVCRMRARRRGEEQWTPEVVWTIDMARAAGLLGKNNWKQHPRRMLQARASSELCELYFPDVVLGFKSVEELEDEGGEEQYAGAEAPAEQPTKVTRKRATKKAAASRPAPAAERPQQPEDAGLPLPGEPGYEELAADQGGEKPLSEAEGTSAGGASAEGEAAEAPPADNQDDSEPVDAEIVPEPEEPAQEEQPRTPRTASRAQLRLLFAALGDKHVGEGERHAVASALLRRPVESFNDLSSADAKALIDTLARCKDRADLDALLEAAEEIRAAEEQS